MSFNSINDNYCDCDDGSDEPGTSACSKSTFRCVNKGYKVTAIPSSRVDDGICDCCDGSDEGLQTAACPNVCDKYASKQREMMEKVVTNFKTGNAVRSNYVEIANKAFSEASNTAATLASEITVVEQQIATLNTIVVHEELMEKSERSEQLLYTKNKINSLLNIHPLTTTQLGYMLTSLLDIFHIHSIQSLVDDIHIENVHYEEVEGTAVIPMDNEKLQFLTHLNPREVTICKELTNEYSLEILFPLCTHVFPANSNQHPILETANELLKEIIGLHKGYKEVQAAYFGVLLHIGITAAPTDALTEVSISGDIVTSTATPPPSTTTVFRNELLVQFIHQKSALTLAECIAEYPNEQKLCELHQELELVYAPHGKY